MNAFQSSGRKNPSLTSRQLLSWIDGLKSEVSFWDQWFQSKGSEWPEDFEQRLRNDRPLPDYLDTAVARCESTPVRILDVGSGPLTFVGTYHPERSVEVAAVDPLAAIYAGFIRREGLTPPVWPEVAFAEDLSAFLPPETFDIVHCRNALDHSFDPVRGLWEMIAMLRVGGQAMLWHAANEAENQRYDGLHQWNFDVQDGCCLLWNKERRHDLSVLLGSHCAVRGERLGECALITIRKDRPLEMVSDDYRAARIRDLLTALADVALQVSASTTTTQLLRRGIARLARWS